MQPRIISLIVCCALGACSKREDNRSKEQASESQPELVATVDATAPNSEAVLRYPSGPWWRGDMSRLYVSAAHILITYDGAETQFLPGAPSAKRSRGEALAKAQGLQTQLERDPSRFAELASSESDDKVTAALEGVLGTFRAARVPPELVDALGHLKPSEVSHVVESGAGFHLLRRLAPPPTAGRSFAHIVIKFDDAMGWRRSDREVPRRSRADALALAQKVAMEAQRAPTRFAELVQQYSEADDVLRGGDLGELNAYDEYGADLSFFTRMARLDPGEVSDVLEGHTGYEIVQRTIDGPREQRAAAVIALPYQGAQSNIAVPSTRTKEKTQKIANTLVRELRAKPALFAERRTEYCELYHCRESFRFRQGRELAALDVAVGKLGIGELGTLDSPIGLLIVRREDPGSIASAELAPVTDFPTKPLDEAALAALKPPTGEPMSPADLVAKFGGQAVRELKLEGEKATGFASIFAELTSQIRARPDADFGEAAAQADAQVLALLGEDKNEEFLRFRRRFFAER